MAKVQGWMEKMHGISWGVSCDHVYGTRNTNVFDVMISFASGSLPTKN